MCKILKSKICSNKKEKKLRKIYIWDTHENFQMVLFKIYMKSILEKSTRKKIKQSQNKKLQFFRFP